MPWDGTLKQHADLLKALIELKGSFNRFVTVLSEDEESRVTANSWGKASDNLVDRSTLERWVKRGLEHLQNADAFKKLLVYEYLERAPRPFRTFLYNPKASLPIGLEDMIASLQPAIKRIRFDRLDKLDGSYKLYRQAWTTPNRNDRILISRLTINTAQGMTRYREEQKYEDNERGGFPVRETDEGIIFYSGTNLFLFGLGADEPRVKFFVVHSFSPGIDGNKSVYELRGTLIGASSAGPHPGFTFLANRVPDPKDEIVTEVVSAQHVDQSIRIWLNCKESQP